MTNASATPTVLVLGQTTAPEQPVLQVIGHTYCLGIHTLGCVTQQQWIWYRLDVCILLLALHHLLNCRLHPMMS